MPSASNPYQLPPARLDWDDNGEPLSMDFDDIYFSRDGGLDETDYVFLQQNRLRERWQALDPLTPGVFVIAETGFGTALNFLAAWQLWQDVAPTSWRLHFISAEHYPLSREQLTRALAVWPQLQHQSALLLAQYPPLVRGFHSRQLTERITLQLLFDDAGTGFAALADSAASLPDTHPASHPKSNNWQVDAWFLDGFSPAKNPDMWSAALYAAIARLSGHGTTFATFTAAGQVRRDLRDLGFNVQKVYGHGKKRSLMRGDWVTASAALDQPQPPAPITPALSSPTTKIPAVEYWARPPLPAQKQRVVVIGGGLAGTHTAHALARRGWPVTLLERSATLAHGASGNPQGVLYTKLSAQAGALAQFALTSYLHALEHYRYLQTTAQLPVGAAHWCGVLQTGVESRLREIFSDQSEWVRYLTAAQASALAGVTVTEDALWFARAGWLRPAQVCTALATHPLIDVRLNCGVEALTPSPAGWHLQTTQGELQAGIVVVTSAHDSLALAPCAHLPLRSIRGQLSDIPPPWVAAQPHTVLCHEGYAVPSADGGLHIGATFDPDDTDTTLRDSDHHRNLQSLIAALPSVLKPDAATNVSTLSGRVGFRCTTPDYLPIVGAVGDAPALRERFAQLARNARSTVAAAPAWQQGLYVNVGHGSRGLTSTPLCAELLAAQICGEPPPLPRALWQALSPARFILRDLIRGRTPAKG